MTDFIVIIPARYGSTRFPGKPLALIKQKPMIQHVYERAQEAGARDIIVATDDQRIADAVKQFDGTVCMTRNDHESGTERLAEVIQKLNIEAETIVVNVQGDEPFIPANNIRQVAQNLACRQQVSMATLSTPINHIEDIDNPNAVKVVVDQAGHALYFSRASIPFDRDGRMEGDMSRSLQVGRRHIGIYAYRADYILRYVNYAPSQLEAIESLEQLRALWYGDVIHVDEAADPPPVGIDSPEDLQRLIREIE